MAPKKKKIVVKNAKMPFSDNIEEIKQEELTTSASALKAEKITEANTDAASKMEEI